MNRLIQRLFLMAAMVGLLSPGFLTSSAAANVPLLIPHPGTVTVSESGEFNVSLCEAAQFGIATVESNKSDAVDARTKICFVDTRSWRPAFTVSLRSDKFVSTTPGITAEISATNLSVDRTAAPFRSGVPAAVTTPSDEGMIFATSNSGVERPARKEGEAATVAVWDSNSLSTGQIVSRGNSGRGLSRGLEGTAPTIQSVIYLELEVPAGQRPASYQTTLTIDLVFTHP